MKSKAKPTHFILRPSKNGDRLFSPGSLEEHIKACLRGCILTHKGERPLRPDLGSEIRDRVFRAPVSSIRNEIKGSLEKVISESEPRVDLLSVELGSDKTTPGRLLVELKYRVKETSKLDGMTIAL